MVVHVVRRLMRYRQNLLCRISSLKLRGTEEGIQCLQHKRLKPDVQAWGLARVSSTERGWKRKKKIKLTENRWQRNLGSSGRYHQTSYKQITPTLQNLPIPVIALVDISLAVLVDIVEDMSVLITG